jgi:hypothetical protein
MLRANIYYNVIGLNVSFKLYGGERSKSITCRFSKNILKSSLHLPFIQLYGTDGYDHAQW